MHPSNFRAVLAGVAVVAGLSSAAAQSPGDDKADKSGTNPAILTRQFNLLTEYLALTNGRYLDTTTLRYTEPFADGKMSVRFEVPVSTTNLEPGSHAGLGDITAKWSWVAYLDRQQGWIVSTEIDAPTASNPLYGTGKWVAAPGITYAYFVNKEIIVAPALIHNVSIAGDSDRDRVSRSDFDLYVVYKPAGQHWWITSDLTISRDFVTQTTPASWRVTLGKTVGTLGDGVVNLSLKPGIGIGPDRPFDWSVELGLAVVGF